jgi:hypothetical protein
LRLSPRLANQHASHDQVCCDMHSNPRAAKGSALGRR